MVSSYLSSDKNLRQISVSKINVLDFVSDTKKYRLLKMRGEH